jgi:hypothetical protein
MDAGKTNIHLKNIKISFEEFSFSLRNALIERKRSYLRFQRFR